MSPLRNLLLPLVVIMHLRQRRKTLLKDPLLHRSLRLLPLPPPPLSVNGETVTGLDPLMTWSIIYERFMSSYNPSPLMDLGMSKEGCLTAVGRKLIMPTIVTATIPPPPMFVCGRDVKSMENDLKRGVGWRGMSSSTLETSHSSVSLITAAVGLRVSLP